MGDKPQRAVDGGMLGVSQRLCLEFVNTVGWRKTDQPEERVPAPGVLLDWYAASGILDAERAALWQSRWQERPQEALTHHRRALAFREALYEIFRSRILSRRIPEDALGLLNRTLADAPPRTHLALQGDTFGWWVPPEEATSPDVLVAPIAWSAADLLTGPRADRIRQCADDRGCGWLFLDESRAGTRRWCSMGDCGNRAKARRHYGRSKSRKSEIESNLR
jgi:predicted RNA-binding Zn ribbon-like protein